LPAAKNDVMCDDVLHLLDLDVLLEVAPPNLTACQSLANGVVTGVNEGLSLEAERRLGGVQVALLLLVLFVCVEEVARRLILCFFCSKRVPVPPPPSAELDETDDDDEDDLADYTDPGLANDKKAGYRV
jgi:hypothetical protein